MILSTDNQSDEYYAARASEGDEKALEYILEKYKKMVISEARKFYIHGFEFEDMLQEANIGLFKAIRTYRPEKGEAFPVFAKMSIRGQIINALEKSKGKGNAALSDYKPIEDENDGSGVIKQINDGENPEESDPEAIYLKTEEIETLRKAINSNLTELEKNVVSMLLEGYSYAEIAEKLGKDKKSVDNARTRIIKKLEKISENRSN